MELSELCNGLFDALAEFDDKIQPLGLYASDELVKGQQNRPQYQEWQGAIVPFLESHECLFSCYLTQQRKYHSYNASLHVPGLGGTYLRVVKFSNIKVRKYGSGFHVDNRENRRERWEKIDLSGHISSLWKQPNFNWFATDAEPNQSRLLLFIGFDKTQRPLERELSELQQLLHWDRKEVLYLTRTWPDKAGRGFGVRLAAWARAAIV
jgi:hypothetical protein